MSIYKSSSLAMIPTAYKDGKLYSVRPTDGSGDFTFSRGSNLAATRVDVNGLIEKGRENLLTYSNEYSNAVWVKSNTSVTSGQSGYDSTNNAWLLSKTAANASIRQNTTQIGVVTSSFYLKSGTLNWAFLYLDPTSGTDPSAYINLNDGSVGTTSASVVDVTTESAGGGWYRCSITANITTIAAFFVFPADSDGNISGTSGNILIQDAQLEQGLVATDYIEATTASAQSGILEDLPRLDYSGGASCPSLLLEPSRTNRVTDSEYLNGTWSENRSTLIVNDDTSPEGVNNATKLQEDTTASNTHFTGKGYSYVSGTTYSWSVYAKADGRDEIVIQQGNPNVVSFNAVFNFTSETAANFGNGTARIEDAGNGWYRCIIEGTTALLSSGTNINVFLRSGNSTTYTGDGTSGVLLYGFQLESNASYATSYIPTYGTSQTRVYDTLNDLDLDGMFSGDSYTILFDIDLNNTFNNKVFATAKKSTGSSSFTFRNFNGLLRVYNNLDSIYLTGSIASDSNKWVVRIDGSTADIFSYNSGSPTKTNGTALTTIRDFGKINFTGVNTMSSLNQFLIFPTALTDSECIALTTI